MDDLLTSIADLIDRARNPAAYQDLKIGNEVLIIGPNQTGKKEPGAEDCPTSRHGPGRHGLQPARQ